MVDRQPGRPSEQEFIGAACRFLTNDYPERPIYVQAGMYVNVFMKKDGLNRDASVIQRELQAEGLPGEVESLEDFATRQLARYQKTRER